MEGLLNAARYYRQLGLSVIATDSMKLPVGYWRQFTERMPGDRELEWMCSRRRAAGIALICGEVSGNLEVLDIDSKYDHTGTLYNSFMAKIAEQCPALIRDLVIVRTRSAGYHLIYRCAAVGGSTKLAQRPTTAEEKTTQPNEKVKVLIETRGTGGYAVTVPTNGYSFLQGSFETIPMIESWHRSLVLDTARSFNQVIESVPEQKVYSSGHYTGSPFDDYNIHGDVVGLLQKHGWTVVRQTGEKTVLKRPGDTDSRSSGDYNHLLGLFSVFSTSTEFRPVTGYRPYAVYTILECNGDYKLAARRLLAEGFGTPYVRTGKKTHRRQ